MNVSRIFSSVGQFFGKSSGKVAEVIPEIAKPVRMTKTLRDPNTWRIIGLERTITRNGQEATARIDYLGNGSRRLTINGGGDNTLWRTTTVTREKGASVFGGDRITVDKDTTKYWCYGEKSTLTKEYNPQGVLQHKGLKYHKNSGNEYHTYVESTQDRVYGEYPLEHSVESMLKDPRETKNIQHSLKKQYGSCYSGKLDTPRYSDNYGNFTAKETNYAKAVKAKEQAAIDAAKKAEQEAIAAKEAAEKAAAELRAKQPRINIGKAFNKDINTLTVKETTLANGTVQRTFTDPDTGKVLAKTEDLGILHKEWIYGGKADMIYMKQVGKDQPYILAKKGNYTQIRQMKKENHGYGVVDTIDDNLYYNDGASSLRRFSCNPVNSRGKIQIYDETAAASREKYPTFADSYPDYPEFRVTQGSIGRFERENATIKKAREHLKTLDKDAQNNVLNLEYLFSDYKA